MEERIKATDAPIWRSKSGDIKLEDMDEKYLQNALNFAQEREFYFFNRAAVFGNKIDEILAEGKKRGIEFKLKENNPFYRNKSKHLNKK